MAQPVDADDGIFPETLKRTPEGGIEIRWSDAVVMRYRPRRLRDACPCASCRERRNAEAAQATADAKSAFKLPVLSAAEARPLEVAAMRPVGNYAYSIAFSDGHSSGIYKFSQLRELGEKA